MIHYVSIIASVLVNIMYLIYIVFMIYMHVFWRLIALVPSLDLSPNKKADTKGLQSGYLSGCRDNRVGSGCKKLHTQYNTDPQNPGVFPWLVFTWCLATKRLNLSSLIKSCNLYPLIYTRVSINFLGEVNDKKI